MNALCAYCPWNYLCPDIDEDNRNIMQRNYALSQENSVLRERMIECGLEVGASIYMNGQKVDVKI